MATPESSERRLPSFASLQIRESLSSVRCNRGAAPMEESRTKHATGRPAERARPITIFSSSEEKRINFAQSRRLVVSSGPSEGRLRSCWVDRRGSVFTPGRDRDGSFVIGRDQKHVQQSYRRGALGQGTSREIGLNDGAHARSHLDAELVIFLQPTYESLEPLSSNRYI